MKQLTPLNRNTIAMRNQSAIAVKVHSQLISDRLSIKAGIKRCPMGGHCFNPLCLFGCVET